MHHIVDFRAYQRFLQLVFASILIGQLSACSIPVCCAPEPQDSMALMHQAENIHSPVLVSLLKQADVFIKQQQWDRATVVLERAQRINNRQTGVWSRLAWISLQQHNAPQAIERARRANLYAANHHPLLAANWQLIAEAYAALKQPKRAAQAKQKSQQYLRAGY